MNLRDSLLSSLKTLPGTREFHIHVLVSSARKHAGLFPFALPRPRTYLQDVLILLSEQATPDSPRVLVTAIEASVYNIPSRSCGILYISKVDTTGQGIHPSPAAVLVKSLIMFYCDPTTRPTVVDHLWVQLFARAQGQYLFPNSSEHPGKRPLSDLKLCAWWRSILSDVALELDARTASMAKAKMKLYYLLPGYSELEATHSLKSGSSSTWSGPTWTYGHPYSESEIPLPCPADSHCGLQNLGHFIPSFDDDPKSRFMDEIAYTTEADGVKSPSRKRPRTTTTTTGHGDVSGVKTSVDEKDPAVIVVVEKDERPLGELAKVSPDEFWERMSFRQECVAGAVTGFFALGMSLPSPKSSSRMEISPLAPQPGEVSSQINKRIVTSMLTGVEFSTVERAVRGTETLESAIKGLCEGITPPTVRSEIPLRPIFFGVDFDRRTPERDSVLLAPPRTPSPNGRRVLPEVSPNPFPEPVTSLETYHSYIYGAVCVSNRALLRAEARNKERAEVRVLAARKKKKRTES